MLVRLTHFFVVPLLDLYGYCVINCGSVGGGGGVPVFQPPNVNFFVVDFEIIFRVVLVVEVVVVVVVVVVVELLDVVDELFANPGQYSSQ